MRTQREKKSISALKNLMIIPGRQRKRASHSHGCEDRIGDHHEGQVDAEMIKQEACDAFFLSCRRVVFCLHHKSKV